jgi:hypothetical protein
MAPCPFSPAKMSKTPIRSTFLSAAFVVHIVGLQYIRRAGRLLLTDSELIKEWVTHHVKTTFWLMLCVYKFSLSLVFKIPWVGGGGGGAFPLNLKIMGVLNLKA